MVSTTAAAVEMTEAKRSVMELRMCQKYHLINVLVTSMLMVSIDLAAILELFGNGSTQLSASLGYGWTRNYGFMSEQGGDGRWWWETFPGLGQRGGITTKWSILATRKWNWYALTIDADGGQSPLGMSKKSPRPRGTYDYTYHVVLACPSKSVSSVDDSVILIITNLIFGKYLLVKSEKAVQEDGYESKTYGII